MFDKFFSKEIGALHRGMNRALEAQLLNVQNMTNISVPGYKAKHIDFNVTLDQTDQLRTKYSSRHSKWSAVDEPSTELRMDGSNVDMEHEIAQSTAAQLRFKACADLMNRQLLRLKSVIREGK